MYRGSYMVVCAIFQMEDRDNLFIRTQLMKKVFCSNAYGHGKIHLARSVSQLPFAYSYMSEKE